MILPLLQVVASKYMNDEGEMEALTNSDWAKLGTKDFPILDLNNNILLLPLVGSMTKTALDDLERNFLSAIVSFYTRCNQSQEKEYAMNNIM